MTTNPKPKILVLDIETKLTEVYTFSIRDTHITHKQIKDLDASARTIHCVGYKWLGERKPTVLSEWEHGYSEMIRRTHALLEEADAVVTYNGASFDIPKLNGQFMLEGIPLPPPLTQIDLYKAARKLGFICNKLDYIAQIMGLGSKVKHPGLEMWIACLNGDAKAQKRMAKYCAGDISLTEEVYARLIPYISDHPHLGETDRDSCGACGSSRLQSRGVRRTKAMFIARHQCQACGSWSSGKRTKAA